MKPVLSTRPPRPRRSARVYAASAVLHIVLGVLLYRIVVMPLPLASLFARNHVEQAPVERISFIVIPRSNAAVSTPGRSGGDGRPERATRSRPFVAPSTVPTTLPPASTTVPSDGGSGAIVGAGGALRGIRPEFTDPRIWRGQGTQVSVPRTPAEMLDSSLMARLGPVRDSMLVAEGMRKPGDWTITKDGKKYGLQKGQYTPAELVLGDVHIPIPMGIAAPRSMDSERERVAARMEREIREHSGQAMNLEDFRTAVKNIRARKERERAASGQGGSGESGPAGG